MYKRSDTIVLADGQTFPQYLCGERPLLLFSPDPSGRRFQNDRVLLQEKGNKGRNCRGEKRHQLDTENGGNLQADRYGFQYKHRELPPNVYVEDKRHPKGGVKITV